MVFNFIRDTCTAHAILLNARVAQMSFRCFFTICRLQGTRMRQGSSSLSEGTEITLLRERDNAKDQNAIRASFRGSTVGYIERDVASILARPIDDNILVVSG